METPNIQLYDLLRHELHMSDGKSLEFMHVLDKEYKSGVKEDLERLETGVTQRMDRFEDRMERFDERMERFDERMERFDERMERFERTMVEGFQRMEIRFDAHERRLDNLDTHVVRLDNKIDTKFGELRGELRVDIRDSKVETLRWMLVIFLAIILMFMGLYLKK